MVNVNNIFGRSNTLTPGNLVSNIWIAIISKNETKQYMLLTYFELNLQQKTYNIKLKYFILFRYPT